MHKKDFGKQGEAIVIQQALANGCSVFPEFGDNSKIDLIVEDKQGKLHRVQVKMVTRERGCSTLYFYKSGPNYKFAYTGNEVDWFAVVDNETAKVAWVEASRATATGKRYSTLTLRHVAPKKPQVYNRPIVWFDDHTKFPLGG